MTPKTPTSPPERVTREDLERSFRALQTGAQRKVEDRKQTLVTAVAVGGVLLVLLIFLLGRRSGKKKSTFVEIRRF